MSKLSPELKRIAEKRLRGEVLTPDDLLMVNEARRGKKHTPSARGFSQRDIAAKLGISQVAVSKMKSKGCPMDSMESILNWREEHSQRHRIAPNEGKLLGEKSEPEQSHAPEKQLPQNADFDERAAAMFEEALNSTFSLYRRAVASQSPSLVAQSLRNLTEAGKAAASIRERFLATREKSRQLVDIDEVISGVGIEVGEWRRLFDTLGTRLAGGRISAEAAKEVQAEIERVKRDLMPRAEMVARAMFAPPEEAE